MPIKPKAKLAKVRRGSKPDAFGLSFPNKTEIAAVKPSVKKVAVESNPPHFAHLTDSDWILELRNVTKIFPGVTALSNVSFKVKSGSILSIVGENGAGKSTLLKVISGVIPASKYGGEVFFKGQLRSYGSLKDSERDGIAIIHQELAISPFLTLYENIFINHYKDKFGVIDWNKLIILSKYYLDLVGLKRSPVLLANQLTPAEQQLLEIAKALSKNAKLLILDEPTSSLNDVDAFALLDLMKFLRDKQGVTCIFVSHKLKEVAYVSDFITVIRDGRHISDYGNADQKINEAQLIKDIVGRALSGKFPPRTERKLGEFMLEVSNLAVDHPHILEKHVVRNASFKVRAGEIIGLSGLIGAGRSETAMNVFGKAYGIRRRGEIIIKGVVNNANSPKAAIKDGLMYASEDRRNEGLVQIFSIEENIGMASYHKYSKFGVLRKNEAVQNARLRREELRIKVPSIDYAVETLSGGNQQKVLLAKALTTSCDILIVDEPTKGIDVGSKFEIYTILQNLAAKGKAIVVISSEIEELMGTADRIYVMSDGIIKGEINASEATPEKIMSIAIGTEKQSDFAATGGFNNGK